MAHVYDHSRIQSVGPLNIKIGKELFTTGFYPRVGLLEPYFLDTNTFVLVLIIPIKRLRQRLIQGPPLFVRDSLKIYERMVNQA